MAHIVDNDEEVLSDDFDELLDQDEEELEKPPTSAEKPVSGSDTPSALPRSPADEEESEDKESYSKRVQKRINKLTQKVRQFEQETQQWKEKVEALEAKTKFKEFTDFQGQIEQSEAQLSRQIETARAAKKTAIEEGDIDAQLKADENILELREQLSEKRRLANAAKEQVTRFQQEQQSRQTAEPPAETVIPDHLPEGTKGWLQSNPWFMKNSDPKAADFARALDNALQEEGYSPDDPEMYQELDKRLRVLVPRLAVAAAKGVPAKLSPKPRVVGSSTDGQRPATAARPERKLTREHLESMRRFGMDPNKPEHRKAWLRRNDPL